MRLIALTTLSLFAFAAQAEAPWGKVDLKAGETQHQKNCVACHVKMYGGDGSKMYTRDGRMLSDKLELLQRVGACNAQMNSGWFPEEEANVAAWLNQKYYKFSK